MPLNKNIPAILLLYICYSEGINPEDETSVVQLGLLYLGTVLKQQGYRVKISAFSYPDHEDIKEIIEKEHTGITGFYVTTENIYRCLKCAGLIKKSFPSMKIIFGGPHASVMDRELMEEYSYIDLIVRKEGEITLPEVVKFYFHSSGNLKDIKGITFREDNQIFQNPDRPFIEDPDIIPFPDRDLLDDPVRQVDITYPRVITGRGCPFSCAFCYEGSGSKYRMRSSENVLSEIDYLLERGEVRYIRFMDDTFTVNPLRTLKICRGLRKRLESGKKFAWFAEGRVDILARHPGLIYEMSLSGLINLHIGVECADQEILDIYEKHITLDDIEQVVKYSADAQIPLISMNFILGGPKDREEIYEKNLDFIRKLMNIAPGRLQITSALLIPFPGTKISKNPERYGLSIIDRTCKTGLTNETVYCETEFLNKCDLIRLKRKFDREIDKIIIETSRHVSPEILEEHFRLPFYGIRSYWHYLLSFDHGMRRFFNWRLHKSYYYIKEISEDELSLFYPVRTYNLNYNEEGLIVIDKLYGQELLDREETLLYELCSGKITSGEILYAGKASIFKDLPENEIYKRVMGFYIKMEKIYALIFSKI